MHMPDFSGYTPDNYRVDFDQDRVEIAYISPEPMSVLEPDGLGAYPPNVFKRASTGPLRSFDPENMKKNMACDASNKGIETLMNSLATASAIQT
jgi:hypothetical protein